MRPNCSVLLALLVLSGASARAQPVRPATGTDVSAPEERARAFVAQNPGLDIAPGATLRLVRIVRTHGFTIVRFVRTAFGGDVLGSSLVVRFSPRGAIDHVGLDGMSAPLASAVRSVDRAQAVPVSVEQNGMIVPAWRVIAGARMHERREVLIDARDGRILLVRPLTLDALGRVYAHNPTRDMDMTTDVTLAAMTSPDSLRSAYVSVASCNATDLGCDPRALAVPDGAGNFLFDPEEPSFTDPFAEVQTYHHASRALAYFRDAHAFTWSCGPSTVLSVYVNYADRSGVPYENAAYSVGSDGCGFLIFGQGAERDYAYDADVVAHEVTHAIVDALASLPSFAIDELGAFYEPAAINEGFADYFAATLSDDPAIGEYFAGVEASESGLRRLDHDLACPIDLSGEPHEDGRIVSGLGWSLRETLGPVRSDALMFVTLASLGSAPTFSELAEVLRTTASSMLTAEQLGLVENALALRGLPCERIVALDAERQGFSGYPSITGAAGGSIAPTHYRIDVPADAISITIRVAPVTTGSYRVYVRSGEPVAFSAPERPPIVADAFYDLDGNEIEIDPGVRCHPLHLAVVTRDLYVNGPSFYRISATIARSGELPCDAPDAGTVLVPGGGCACRAGAPSPSSAFALVLILALCLRARSR